MKANRFANNDEGVSAVIGVILMVAVTVILAAVIAAFVFGMAGGVKKTYTVAATASRAGSIVTVTYNGGPDADQIKGIQCTIDGATTGFSPALTTAVGSSGQVTSIDKVHVVVIATFMDNSQSVILDSNV